MSDWINAKKQPPTKEDSPILASKEYFLGCFNVAALHWLDEDRGWDGEGWYDHSEEYGMKLEQILFWMPLPSLPKDEE